MDIDDTPDEAAFRAEVRAYLDANLHRLARHSTEYPETKEQELLYRQTQKILYEGGLVGAGWPSECGGRDATGIQQVIIGQEIGRAGIPPLIGGIGVGMCGPTVVVHGTERQKALLPRLLDGTDVWAQLFSEPGAGSDLAAISTKAVPVDGGWVVNGQKVWTSGAHYSAWGILLTRTDPTVAKHRGLTMFIVDMTSAGVTVRPLRQLTGQAHFNEVFFDDVFVPADNLLGPVNGGWGVALTTLMNERMALGGGGGFGSDITALLKLAREKLPTLDEGQQAIVRQDLGRLYAATLAVRWGGFRRLTALSKGETPGPEASAGKLIGTSLVKDTVATACKLLGTDAAFAESADGTGYWQYLQGALPGWAIAGGATEILKNILGERVLGLPQEPRLDKHSPVSPQPQTSDPVRASANGAHVLQTAGA